MILCYALCQTWNVAPLHLQAVLIDVWYVIDKHVSTRTKIYNAFRSSWKSVEGDSNISLLFVFLSLVIVVSLLYKFREIFSS